MNPAKMEAKKEVVELRQKIDELNDAILLISGLMKSVQDDVDKTKNEIHSAFNSQMNLLHHREEQLLRQVDVLSADEMNFLHTKCAELHHLIGSVESYLRSMEESPDAEFMNAIDRKIDSINRMKKRTLNLKFVTDSTGLQSAIQNFGQVNTSCALLGFSQYEGSTSLPLKIEYEDKEHHLMYKTLDGSSDVSKNPGNAKTSFAKLFKQASQLNDSDWLVSSLPKKNDASSRLNNKASSGDNLFKFDETNKNMSSVQNWLREMSSADECDLPLKSEMNNRPLSWVDSSSQSSLDDSIVLLSLPRPCSTCDCAEIKLVTPNLLHSEWLSKESQEFRRRHSLVIDCPIFNQKSTSHCANDDTATSNVKPGDSLWLAKEQTSPKNQKRFSMPDIKEACCANELCKNFYECISDENCALARGNDRELLGNKPLQLIKPMLNVMYEKNASWISPPTLDSEVEDKTSSETNEAFTSKRLGFLNYHLNNDLKNWLDSSSATEFKGKRASVKDLSEKADAEKSPILAKKMANMFQPYFAPAESCVWLSRTTFVEKESVVF